MDGFLGTVLNIVIFIVSLGALIVIHELGHLSTAKLFKVYCYEFSVGMGPALFKHKRKGGETIFSVRALPIGGYVAMAGEDMDDSEKDSDHSEVVVPKERTIEGIARWKRVIIMGAGVFLNFILGYVLFFINYSCVEQVQANYDGCKISVQQDSLADKAGLIDGDDVKEVTLTYHFISLSNDITRTYEVDCYAFESAEDITYETYNRCLSNILGGKVIDVEATKAQNPGKELNEITDASSIVYVDNQLPTSEQDSRTITLKYERNGEIKQTEPIRTAVTLENDTYKFGILGISIDTIAFRFSFGEAFVVAWKQWVYACGAIFVGLASLFTPAGWAQAGGIISIFKISTIAVSQGVASVLNMWGIISVNLAIMNLLPFPGLDGWQILVTTVEGVTRKEIPQKVKGIMSTIGLILLIGLSIALIIKDIVAPAI